MKLILAGIIIAALLLPQCSSKLVFNRSMTSVSHGSRAYSHFAKGEIGAAVAFYRKAAHEAIINDIPLYHAKYIMNIGRCFYEIDSVDSALWYLDNALSAFAFYKDKKSVSVCYGLRAMCFIKQQRYDSASLYCNANITDADPYLRHYWLSISARERCAQNDLKKAEEYLDMCVRYYTKKKMYDALSSSLLQMATIYVRGNRYQEAIDTYHKALSVLEKTDFQLNRWRILDGISDAFSELGDTTAARIFCERARSCTPDFVAEAGCR